MHANQDIAPGRAAVHRRQLLVAATIVVVLLLHLLTAPATRAVAQQRPLIADLVATRPAGATIGPSWPMPSIRAVATPDARRNDRARRVEVADIGTIDGPWTANLDLGVEVTDLIAAPSGPLVYAAAPGRGVVVIDATTAEVRREIDVEGEPRVLDLDGVGEILYVGTGVSTVVEIDLATGLTRRTVDVSDEVASPFGLGDIELLPDGRVVVTGDLGRLAVYDVDLLLPTVTRIEPDGPLRTASIEATTDGTELVVVDQREREIVVLDLTQADGPVLRSVRDICCNSLEPMALLPDDSAVVLGNGGVYDLGDLALRAELVGPGVPFVDDGTLRRTTTQLGFGFGDATNMLVTLDAGLGESERWPLLGCPRDGRGRLHPVAADDGTIIATTVGTFLCLSATPGDVSWVDITVSNTQPPGTRICVDLLDPDLSGRDGLRARLVVDPVPDQFTRARGWVRPVSTFLVRAWGCGEGLVGYGWLDAQADTSPTYASSQADRQSLPARQTVVGDIFLGGATSVTGVVRDARTGRPLPGIEVSAIDPDGVATPRFGITDADGLYGFAGFPVQSSTQQQPFQIRFRDPAGQVPDEWWFDQPDSGRADTLIATEPDVVVQGVDAAMGSIGTERFSGEDRFETAALFSQAAFAPGVAVAYLATGRNFPDALAATPASARGPGPILLTERDTIPDVTRAELRRLGPARIVLLGGPAALTDTVFEQAEEFATAGTSRVSGPDRYATAAEVVRTVFPGEAPIVVIATGEDFPDALAAGAVAAAADVPLLLVQRGSIPEVTADALRTLRPQVILVAGGDLAISPGVVAQLRSYASQELVQVAGTSRFDTAAQLSALAFAPDPFTVFVTTGSNFPDALAGGGVAGLSGGPLLLVPPGGPLPGEVSTELARLSPRQIVVLGGPNAVAPEVLDQLSMFAG